MLDEYYRRFDESERLTSGLGSVELIRTRDILARWLPPPPAVLYDIGGGTGIYAVPLAEAGYDVHLIDPVQDHVERARQVSDNAVRPLASCELGDARDLKFPDGTADALLILGPLYHLSNREDRIAALTEAARVLRPGGRVIAAAISRFASTIDGVTSGFIADPAFARIVEGDLTDGHHRNPSGDPRYFTDAHFHLPDELRSEILEAGFNVDAMVAIEGPMWNVSESPLWSDETQRALVLDLLRRIEAEPSLIGATAHFMAIATKA